MGAGGQSAKYSYDAFDRPTAQSSTGGPSGAKTTLFSYIGLTEEVAEEEQRSGSATGALQSTKGYSFDSSGNRTGMSETKPGGTQADYSYGQDAHGSTSQLIGEGGAKDGQAQASYGYTPYGEPDKDLTSEKDPSDATGQAETKPDDPLNNYRYSSKRLDPASGQLDMGARRYSPDTSRFVQEDLYEDALGNIGPGHRSADPEPLLAGGRQPGEFHRGGRSLEHPFRCSDRPSTVPSYPRP